MPAAGALAFAWTGAALFAAALLYFLFTYLVTFGETAATGDRGRAIVWNVTLFTAFALHHSVFARERIRDGVRRVAGELERSVYVWISSVLLIVVCAAWADVPGMAWQARGIAAWALRGVQLFGGWLTLRSAAIIDVFDLAGLRQLNGDARSRGAGDPQRSGEFKTDGPYGWVRHPIYSGWFLLVFAEPTMTMTRLVFAIASCVYLLAAIPLEERSLRRSTAGSYDAYMREVRWKLVPGLFGWWLAVGGW